MVATYKKYILNFKQASGTSRGVLTTKETWFLQLEKNGKKGIGECGLLRGLSVDDRPDYELKLKWLCQNINQNTEWLFNQLIEFPSIQFGLETALLSLNSDNSFILFESDFTKNKAKIPINGLIWMGTPEFMKQQIETKIAEGFTCVKLKIGAINFEKELELLQYIRANFKANQIEIRVDANGAFTLEEALYKLNQLHQFELHSIEQPIKQGNKTTMAQLCKNTPFPIALDEELIGIFNLEDKKALLEHIKPQFIILKPSFIGGIKGTNEWITLAEEMNIGWWITSALETNIGLNAIAQYTFTKNKSKPQGLGTGGLYTNNFNCPLEVKNGFLGYNNNLPWEFNFEQI